MRPRHVRLKWLRIVGLTVLVGLLTGPSRAGTLYVADVGAGTIDAIAPNGAVSTFASGLLNPIGLSFDSAGNLYASVSGGIDKITPGGSVSTFASGIEFVGGLAFDSAGILYASFFDENGVGGIDKITPGGSISTFASGIAITGIGSLAFDSAGNLYLATGNYNDIDKITPGGSVSTFVAGIPDAIGLAFGPAGNLYAIDGNGDVNKITPSGSISTFASGFFPYTTAGLTFDGAGNLYVASGGTIAEVTPSGSISTFASGLNQPAGLAFAPQSVPEPSSLLMGLISLGLAGGCVGRKLRRSHGRTRRLVAA